MFPIFPFREELILQRRTLVSSHQTGRPAVWLFGSRAVQNVTADGAKGGMEVKQKWWRCEGDVEAGWLKRRHEVVLV